MPCEESIRIEQKIKQALDDVLQWRTENAAVRGPVSEPRREKLEKAASDRLRELTDERFHHARSCGECKHDRDTGGTVEPDA
jgi:hypothetical protein